VRPATPNPRMRATLLSRRGLDLLQSHRIRVPELAAQLRSISLRYRRLQCGVLVCPKTCLVFSLRGDCDLSKTASAGKLDLLTYVQKNGGQLFCGRFEVAVSHKECCRSSSFSRSCCKYGLHGSMDKTPTGSNGPWIASSKYSSLNFRGDFGESRENVRCNQGGVPLA